MGIYQNHGEKVGFHLKDETARVVLAVHASAKKTFSKAGALLRGIARRLIRRSKKPSAPGQPPHTQTGNLKNAILFGADDNGVVIGPTATRFGAAAATLEFGGVEPPKPNAKPNFVLEVGGHGPIRGGSIAGRRNAKGQFRASTGAGMAFARLLSPAQAERAKQIAAVLPASVRGGGEATTRHYKARPYMSAALTAGATKLEAVWKNSVKS